MKKEPGISLLFRLCWCAYFCAYIGRLNYSAALTDMIRSEGFGKGEAGLIGTAFFFAYGAGQFVSGFLGDRLLAKWLVFTGLSASGACNLLMAQGGGIGFMSGVWCVNGLMQALIWSPMLRLVTDYCRAEVRSKLCAALNSAVPVGTMAAYGITAVLLGISGWRRVPAGNVCGVAFGHQTGRAGDVGAGRTHTGVMPDAAAERGSNGDKTEPDIGSLGVCTAVRGIICAGSIEGRCYDVDSGLHSGDLWCQSDPRRCGHHGDTAV